MKEILCRLSDYIELSKLKVLVPVSITGFTGYFIYRPHLSWSLLLVTAGILLLAISASVFNQVQEAELDAKMNRTRNRPLPSGRISNRHAVIYSVITLAAGTAAIYLPGNIGAVMIGFVTILIYNAIYTPLKKVTPFALLPGALAGALPPMIGWVAAGGGVFDKPVLFVCFLLFMGQIPHFWLLLVRYAEEYRSAGIPCLTGIFSNIQIGRLTFTWVAASAVAAVFLCLFEIIQQNFVTAILMLASGYLIWRFRGLLRETELQSGTGKYSVLLNSYFLLIMILLISDRILPGR
jgi:heme o synthase